MKRIEVLEVLKIVSFRALWLAQVFSQIAINLLTLVLAIRVYELTGKNTAVSLLTLAFVLPSIIFSILAGILVDRYDKKIILFLCNLTRGIAVLGFLLSSESIMWVYILVALLSFITQFFVPAEAPTIPTIVPKANLLIANSLFTLTIFITVMAGGILAGPLLNMIGLEKTFAFVVLMFFIAAYFITTLPGQSVRSVLKRRLLRADVPEFFQSINEKETWDKLKSDLSEGINYIRHNSSVLTAMILLVCSQTIIASFSTLMPGLADQVIKISVNDATVYLLGPAIVGIVLGTIVVSQFGKKWDRRKSVNISIAVVTVCLALLGLNKNLFVAQVLLFVIGLSNAVIDVTVNTTLQTETKEEVRSRIYGIFGTMTSSAYILPVLLSGALSDLFGVDKVFLFGGILLFFAWFKLRRLMKV